MTADRTPRESYTFEDFPRGPRWRAVTEPGTGPIHGTVLLLPPFAEEANKTRRMSALMARALADDGWRTVRLDLFGCGDSAGEFRDATWVGWIDDLRTELTGWVRHSANDPVCLWAVRAGALFVPALLDLAPTADLLLWQPVMSGKTHLQQFLRLHAASAMLGAAAASTSGSPAAQLASGNTVEVAGYELSAAMADGLKSAEFDLAPGTPSRTVVWFEVSVGAAADLTVRAPPATQRALDRLSAAGHRARFEAVAGPPFWQSTEIEVNAELVRRSCAALKPATVAAARAN